MSDKSAGLKRRRGFQDALGSVRPDSGAVLKIGQHLGQEGQTPSGQINIEHAAKIARGGCEMLESLGCEGISQTGGLIHAPGIIVTDKNGQPQFISEQDGMIHESEGHMKRDRARNGHYVQAGIPRIVLNTKEIRYARMIHAKYMDRETRKAGVTKPAGLNPLFFSGRSEIAPQAPHRGIKLCRAACLRQSRPAPTPHPVEISGHRTMPSLSLPNAPVCPTVAPHVASQAILLAARRAHRDVSMPISPHRPCPICSTPGLAAEWSVVGWKK